MWRDIVKSPRTSIPKEGLPVSINDIRDKYFNQETLTEEERKALTRFDHYRIWYLNGSEGELEFHARYEELQAKANLSPYEEFLKDDYDLPTQ